MGSQFPPSLNSSVGLNYPPPTTDTRVIPDNGVTRTKKFGKKKEKKNTTETDTRLIRDSRVSKTIKFGKKKLTLEVKGGEV